MTRIGLATLVATVLGLALALWTLGSVGLDRLIVTVSAIGVGGFLAYLGSAAGVLAILGGAWAASTPRRDRAWYAFVWARAVREAANDLLPFSQLGGLILGVRELLRAGVAPAGAYAGTVIDLTTEMASQLVLVLAGLAIGAALLGAPDAAHIRAASWAGLGAMVIVTLAFIVLQRPALGLAARLATRVAPDSGASIAAARDELAAFGKRPAAFVPSFAWNMLAWLAAIASSWLALHLLGARVPVRGVFVMEALISVVRSGAFIVPGAIGVQEAGYVLLAPLLGIGPETALALALLKRARDVAIGVPTLLALQARLFGRRTAISTGR